MLYDFKSVSFKTVFYEFNVLEVLGFDLQFEIAAVNCGAFVGALVQNGCNVTSAGGYDFGNADKLPRLIHKLEGKRTLSAAH